MKIEVEEQCQCAREARFLLHQIRQAIGDNGERSQPELLYYLRELKFKVDAMDAKLKANSCPTTSKGN